jgi:hypothetical protein
LSEVHALLHKAAWSLNAAEALLLEERLRFSGHGSVIGEYGRLADRTPEPALPPAPEPHVRRSADLDTDFDLDRSRAQAFIEERRTFPDAARVYRDREDIEERETHPENG